MEKDKKKIAAGAGILGVIGLLWCLLRKRLPPVPPPPPGKATLHGRITDAQTGAAIQGIGMSFDGYTGTSDATGYYLIENITPGEYSVTFSDPLGRYEPKTL